MTRPCLPPDPETRRPAYRPPPKACDSHAHVFADYARYPLSANRSFTPPEAPVEHLLRMLDVLGVQRGVIVHSSAYGTDTRVSEAAVRCAPDRLRGVAVTAPDTPYADLERLDAAGFSGSRLSTVVKGTLGFDALEAIAARIKPFGWHVAVHVNRADELVDLAPRLLAIGNPIVIDHVARVRGDEGTANPGYRALLELLRSDRCWVKVSALHRTSSQPYPWADMRPLVEGVLQARPDRVVWGTDWPHVNQYDDMQNDGDLLDAFAGWVPDDGLREQVLVRNPAELYRFPSTP
ncbi:MAG TPA: amidohydrolase family protein [Ramlibacter sp.]|nr:amidohydrolase family protein [Ramlibacter sp.]